MIKLTPKLKLGCQSCANKLKDLDLDSLRKVEVRAPKNKETAKITVLRGKHSNKNKNALF